MTTWGQMALSIEIFLKKGVFNLRLMKSMRRRRCMGDYMAKDEKRWTDWQVCIPLCLQNEVTRACCASSVWSGHWCTCSNIYDGRWVDRNTSTSWCIGSEEVGRVTRRTNKYIWPPWRIGNVITGTKTIAQYKIMQWVNDNFFEGSIQVTSLAIPVPPSQTRREILWKWCTFPRQELWKNLNSFFQKRIELNFIKTYK